MAFLSRHGVCAFQFDLFDQKGLVHGIYTRAGGVSPAPWASLNLGGTVGDERGNVIENRRRIFESIDRPVKSVFDAWQVHGTHAIATDSPRPLDAPHLPADIILTDRPEITLFMRFADCVPILFFDPVRRVVAMAHAGWKGTLSKACLATVRAMQEAYHTSPADIFAGIGPSICPKCYEVGAEVVERARHTFHSQADEIIRWVNGKSHLDLWEANRLALLEAGVRPGNIETAGICTAENLEHWYSHRGENGRTGRFGALIGLET